MYKLDLYLKAVELGSPVDLLTRWSAERLPVHLLLDGDAWKIISKPRPCTVLDLDIV